MSDAQFIEARGIDKRYAGVHALKGVSLSVEAGTIHGLVGENGAGKSTMGKIIGGIVSRDGGDLLIGGRPVAYRSPLDALDDGVAMIQQELALVPMLSVEENVFLGVEPRSHGTIDRETIRQRYEELEKDTAFGLAPEAIVGGLSVANQQKVEILRALARNARIVIMDEPTSSLGHEDSEHLHEVVRTLRARGMTVLYVSHFLQEVIELTDGITVFRNGEIVETVKSDQTTVESLVHSMLGQPMSAAFPEKKPAGADAEVALEVKGLTRKGVFRDISFNVRRGEILGMAGLVGSGRTEVAKAVFGADSPDSGSVKVYGEELRKGSPPASIAAGVAFAPEDRKQEGLLLELSQRVNVTLPHLKLLRKGGMISRRAEGRRVSELLERLDVYPRSGESPVVNLSGGNQQKVLFAKWLFSTPRVLILDEPTRGVDVGAKSAIYKLITTLADEGLAVIVISSELEEILGLAHRVIVMRGGVVERELDTENVRSDVIMQASFGVDAIEQVASGR